MERQNLCLVLVTVMLLSTSFIAGCTDPFLYRKGSCPDCGCHYYGTNFRPDDQAQLTITGPDIAHSSEFAKASFHLHLVKTDYDLRVASVIPATNTSPQKIVYDVKFAGPTDVSSRFKVPEKVWTDYAIELNVYSTDPYISNMTFFNGTNNIKGKLWNENDGGGFNMTVDPALPGVAIEHMEGRGGYLLVNTTQWYFGINVGNGIICAD